MKNINLHIQEAQLILYEKLKWATYLAPSQSNCWRQKPNSKPWKQQVKSDSSHNIT